MTCIVGIISGDKVHMGADSAETDKNGCLDLRADSKVFIRDGFMFGVAGSWRLNQILKYKIKLPSPPVWGDSVHEYVSSAFIDSLRASCKEEGFLRTESGVEEIDGNFLVGVAGRLYNVWTDLQVGCPSKPFTACGSGEQVARGALYVACEHLPFLTPATKKLTYALEAAERFCSGVRGPFTVLSL